MQGRQQGLSLFSNAPRVTRKAPIHIPGPLTRCIARYLWQSLRQRNVGNPQQIQTVCKGGTGRRVQGRHVLFTVQCAVCSQLVRRRCTDNKRQTPSCVATHTIAISTPTTTVFEIIFHASSSPIIHYTPPACAFPPALPDVVRHINGSLGACKSHIGRAEQKGRRRSH